MFYDARLNVCALRRLLFTPTSPLAVPAYAAGTAIAGSLSLRMRKRFFADDPARRPHMLNSSSVRDRLYRAAGDG